MKKRTRKRIFRFASLTAGLLVVVLIIYLGILYTKITGLFLSRGFPSPSIVYSDVAYLKKGMGMSRDMLIDKLGRLGYTETGNAPSSQGTYEVSDNRVSIDTKTFNLPFYTLQSVQAVVELSDNKITEISTSGGKPLDSLELEPEQLAVFFGDDFKMRVPASLSSIPDDVINAVIVTEDARFFEHGPIDINGIFRAMLADILSMSIRQGGSTITQQLVKILFLSNRRTFRRKITEAVMAIMIAQKFTKAQILNAYLNDIYLGQDGHVSIVGMGAAARYYYSESLGQLSLTQSAMLAGLIASPMRYSPIYNPGDALKRRNMVLSKMLKYQVITQDTYDRAATEPLDIKLSHITVKSAPYFVDYVSDQLKERFSKELLTRDGLRIFTTIDMDTQLMAEQAMDKAPAELQGAMVILQPQTGYVLAMIGGRDYNTSQFNRAVMSRRQIGSCVKPFIYMLALESRAKQGFSQVSTLEDAMLRIKSGAGEWEPQNYDKRFRGSITARYALQHSINIPAVKVAMQTGLDKNSELLEQLGFGADIPSFPSLALGSITTSPLSLALAYTIFSNNGNEPQVPVSIKTITDMQDTIIYKADLEFKSQGTAQGCYVVNNILLGSTTEGTARGLREFHIAGDYAGKTGTTNDFRDVWFAGYTPDVVAVDWLGYDEENAIGSPAAQIALPVIGRFLEMYTDMHGGRKFDIPPGIKFACVDRHTGLAGKGVTNCVTGAFIAGTEPKQGAINSVIDWFRRMLH